MRQFVELTFGENETEFTVAFDSLGDIDFVIERLEELRAELEHQIEMERQRKREKKRRAKLRRKENRKEVMQFPIKLKNGNNFVVTCDDVIFNEGNLALDYVLNGELVMTIPLSSIKTEPDFEE